MCSRGRQQGCEPVDRVSFEAQDRPENESDHSQADSVQECSGEAAPEARACPDGPSPVGWYDGSDMS